MNDFLSSSWLDGNYTVSGFQVFIKTSMSFAVFTSVDSYEDFVFQGDEADDVINEIAGIWNKSDCSQDEAIAQWIAMHL